MNPHYKISLLLPSNRPDSLAAFIQSLKANSLNFKDIQLIILKDAPANSIVYDESNITIINRVPSATLHMGELNHECFKMAKGKYIFFANDDLICETPGWDAIVLSELEKFQDDVVLVWPNDNMFGNRLACFPIVPRRLLESVNFFPIDYKRYKIDDTLFDIVPQDRRIYLEHVMFRHKNDDGTIGFPLGDGRIYPVDQKAGKADQKIWDERATYRTYAKTVLYNSMVRDGESEIKVLIGVPIGLVPRFGEFDDYLAFLQKPQNTVQTKVRGQSPARNRNLIIKQALDAGCSHVLFLDDDMAFHPDLLIRLLKHDKDIVSGLYFLRSYPHPPAIFDRALDNGYCGFKYLKDDEVGLTKIVAAGLGCCLIKTDVFRKMKEPWIRLGEIYPDVDMWSDDIGFFNRARKEATTDIWCDLDAICGHAGQCIYWPVRLKGAWYTTYDTRGEGSVSTPQVKLKAYEEEPV